MIYNKRINLMVDNMRPNNDGKISTCKITDELIGSGSGDAPISDGWEGF